MNERTNDNQFVIIYVIKFKPFARVIAAIKRLKELCIVYIWGGDTRRLRNRSSSWNLYEFIFELFLEDLNGRFICDLVYEFILRVEKRNHAA